MLAYPNIFCLYEYATVILNICWYLPYSLKPYKYETHIFSSIRKIQSQIHKILHKDQTQFHHDVENIYV